MKWQAKWIRPQRNMEDVVPVFGKEFQIKKELKRARLYITALGVYEAKINGKRVGEYVLAPGWTSYEHRLQYQEYDVTQLMEADNKIAVWVGKGWYRSDMSERLAPAKNNNPAGLLAQLELEFVDGSTTLLLSDTSWQVTESCIRFSEIYDGEIYDASFVPQCIEYAEVFEGPSDTLIPQEGEEILEQEIFDVAKIMITPKGETVIDFGQEITGYVEISVDAKIGEKVRISHGEVLDKDGNFYNDNYRTAKSLYIYQCKNGKQTYHPRLTFYGFRYIRVEEYPGGLSNVKAENFKAIAVYSDIKQTGYLSCSNPLLNKLFSNVIWGQKDNYLDVPTDCPQRDERLGWTGDAQVFARAAALNFDVEKFFSKWLGDMRAEQSEEGIIPHFIPNIRKKQGISAGWSDAATICAWELYMAYGNPEIIMQHFLCMKKYVDYITASTEKEYLWIGGIHYGDWLGLDAPTGSYKGSSRDDLIASAYYAYSTSLLIKAGHALDINVVDYEELYQQIVNAFQETYTEYYTQTEYAIAIHFRLAKDCKAMSDKLAELIKSQGVKLQTGFIGTPYLLHALSDYGHAELAYTLLLRTEYPSWLYPVTKGATTIWEHWDGIMEDGSFWDSDMNSFNHYAYGAVIDWIYTVAAGIKQSEEYPGYQQAYIAPIPDKRLDWLKATLHTRHGTIVSKWEKKEGAWHYEITTPVETKIVINNIEHYVNPGTYHYYSIRNI